MAPEEDAGTELLLQSFERRFLAARALRSFPWQSLEAKLRDSSDSELLRDILQKHEAVHTEPLDELYEALAETLMAEESPQGHRSYLLMCCIVQKPSCRWSGSCGGWLPAGSTSGLLRSTWPSLSATRRHASCSPPN
ncbi:protein-lysine N-methyltransferase EEF2KMT isoform X4 [Theropithecus gelada]|uniref:protein-lysine N-methyltransferase EEF2KMT isoform X4 n=1 Tax=Theropithecus gelada TaxID=9565 RepID=UPI000DC17527|nr:protein-lysine N-methyltransferase EEF2KMT isoform X4 [Theropithecus gelada]